MGAIPPLVRMGVEEKDESVRRKGLYALSSEVRNYQPGMDEALKAMPKGVKGEGGVDARDMEAVDGLMERLRQHS